MTNILKKEKSSSKGFTLIELLVVIAIIILLSTIFIVNYRAGGRQLALERSAHQLAHDIRRAQAMAMATEECPPGTNCEGDVPPGYGIYLKSPGINTTSSILFADSGDISHNGFFVDTGPLNNRDAIIEEIFFNDGVFLSSIEDSGCDGLPPGQGQRRSHITFSPPDPIVNLSIGLPPTPHLHSCSEIVLTLQVGNSSGPTRSVRVNRVGLIEVE